MHPGGRILLNVSVEHSRASLCTRKVRAHETEYGCNNCKVQVHETEDGRSNMDVVRDGAERRRFPRLGVVDSNLKDL